MRVDQIRVRCEDPELQECHWEHRQIIANTGPDIATITGSAGTDLRDPIVSVLGPGSIYFDYEAEVAVDIPNEEIHIELPGNSEVHLLVRGEFSFSGADCGCWASGIRRRHPVVSRGPDPRVELDYVFDDGLPRSDIASAHVTFEYDGPGRIRPHFRPRRTYRDRVGGRRLTTMSYDREPIMLGFSRRPPFVRGGPFVAVGGGWNSKRALRLRAGWEVAAPRWLVFAGAVESDTTDLRFIPTVSVMSGHSWFPLLPGTALGLGVPVQTMPDSRIGVRAQAELFWHIVAIVGAVDVYPERDGARVVGSLFGQVSF